MQAFNQSQIEALKKEYGKIKGMDPASSNYVKLIKLLESIPQANLEQLAAAKIPFVSMLAKNRIK